MVVERDDIAYVGEIVEGSNFYLIAAYGGGYVYGLPIMGVDTDNFIILSKGAFSVANSGRYINSWDYLYFSAHDVVRLEDGSISCRLSGVRTNGFNSSPITLGRANVSSTDRLGDNPEEPGDIVFSPINDPDGYGGGLLSGTRYRMSVTRVLYVNYITNETQDPNTGLYNFPNSPSIDGRAIEWITWLLVPMEVFQYTYSPPTAIASIMPHVSISQCASITDPAYLNSASCFDWKLHRGFVTKNDVQPIIYYYSMSGECGESYSFEDIKGRRIQVDTSNGYSCSDCGYDGNVFLCGGNVDDSDPTEPDDGGNSNLTEPDDGGDSNSSDDRILSNIWIWLGLGIVIIIIIVLTVIVLLYALGNRG